MTAIAGQGGEIEQKVNAFPSLGRGLPGFLSDMTAFGNNVASRSPLVVQQVDPTPPATDPLTIQCPFCTELQTSLNSAVSDMDSMAMPVYNQIESSKSAALTEIVNVNQEIQTRIGEARTQVADINDKATRYNDKVVEYTDYVDKYEKVSGGAGGQHAHTEPHSRRGKAGQAGPERGGIAHILPAHIFAYPSPLPCHASLQIRRPIVLVLFLVPLLLSLLWFILVVGARKEFGGKVIVHLLFPFGLLVFVIFMVHLPFSLLIADSCHYLDEKEPALASVSSFEPIVADTLTACMARQNLLSALGVADDLDFTNKIAFPTVPSVDGLLDAQRLRDLDSQVQAASLSSFPDYNPAEKGAQLDALNGITNAPPYGDYFTFQNVSACTPVKYVASVDEVKLRRNAVLTQLRAEEQINSLLGELQGNMTALMNEFDGLRSSTQTLLVRMGELNTTVTPLLDAAQAVVAIAYCSPLDEDYLRMKQTYCDKMIVSVSALAMASFFVGVFMFLLNVALWFLVYRLQHGAETVANSGLVGGAGGNDLYGAPAGVGVTVGAGSTLMASPTPMIASPSAVQMGGGAFSPSGDRSLELAQVPVQVYADQMPGRTNDF